MEAGSGETDAQRNERETGKIKEQADSFVKDANKQGIEDMGPHKAGALKRVSMAIRRVLALKKSQG